MIQESELVLRDDNSVYHLGLLPHEIAHDIITVGDPDRVDAVASHLDTVELTKQIREFKTITGSRNGKRWSIISTGIGTDNIDIVLNELDALVNVDLDQRKIKTEHTALRLHRLGTSGTIRSDVPVDSMIVSRYAVDLGSLGHYYHRNQTCSTLSASVDKLLKEHDIAIETTAWQGNNGLIDKAPASYRRGITFTAPGFYAPQGRAIRLAPRAKDYLDSLSSITYQTDVATNLEMETAGIYMLSHLLGHHAVSISAILANRKEGKFSKDPAAIVEKMIADFFEYYG